MPTRMRLINAGPGRDRMFDAERLPGHGLEITLCLAKPRRRSGLIVPPTPLPDEGPEAWVSYRSAGALAVTLGMTEVRVAVDGLVTRSLQPWDPDRSEWLLTGRTEMGMSSFVPQNTKVKAHYDHYSRCGKVWFTWRCR